MRPTAGRPRAPLLPPLLALLALQTTRPSPAADDDSTAALNADALKVYASLTPEQRAKAVLPFDSPDRDQEMFPRGFRAGIQICRLSPEQKQGVMRLVAGFTSETGRRKAEQIAAQSKYGIDTFYLAFFGVPGEGKSYAWRVAGHHLTLVHVDVEEGQPVTFGPILQGSNPPEFLEEEEDAMIALYAALTPEERKKVAGQGAGTSTDPVRDQGALVRDLSPAAREKVRAVFDNRLGFFAPPVARRVREIVEGQGGLDGLRVVFFGEATKRCKDGGLWDFKLGGPGFLCDYENSRKHIHMAIKGRLAEDRAGGGKSQSK